MSGVRAAPLGPSDPTPPVGVRVADAGNMHASSDAPQPSAPVPHFPIDERTSASGPQRRYDKVSVSRLQFDSGEMTQVASPNPMLLAVARGEMIKAPRRLTWFAAGMAVGAIAVWFATSDVRADIYAARVHVASILRSLRGQVSADDPPAALVIERSELPATGGSANDANARPAIPRGDVAQLPHAKGASQASQALPISNPPVAAPPPGAPTLANAPGPR